MDIYEEGVRMYNFAYIKFADNREELVGDFNNIINRIKYIIKKIFYIPTIKMFENKRIYIFPRNKLYNIAKTEKMIDKLAKKLDENQIDNIIICKELNKNDKFKNIIYSKNLNILDGKWLYNFLLYDILIYILMLNGLEIENQEIHILMNDTSDINLDNIIKFAQICKRVNIITNNPSRFKNIENNLYADYGITLSISNNKKKSLSKAKIILNIDFPEEIINKYIIYRKAIIVNVRDEIKIYSKAFEGINIIDYQIELNKKYKELLKKYNLYEDFENNVLYESVIYRKDNIQNIIEQIKNDDIKIINLFGKRGIIEAEEYRMCQ